MDGMYDIPYYSDTMGEIAMKASAAADDQSKFGQASSEQLPSVQDKTLHFRESV